MPVVERQPSTGSPFGGTPGGLPGSRMTMDSPQGFLYEWWMIFWDVFNARTERGGSANAARYYQYINMKTQNDPGVRPGSRGVPRGAGTPHGAQVSQVAHLSQGLPNSQAAAPGVQGASGPGYLPVTATAQNLGLFRPAPNHGIPLAQGQGQVHGPQQGQGQVHTQVQGQGPPQIPSQGARAAPQAVAQAQMSSLREQQRQQQQLSPDKQPLQLNGALPVQGSNGSIVGIPQNVTLPQGVQIPQGVVISGQYAPPQGSQVAQGQGPQGAPPQAPPQAPQGSHPQGPQQAPPQGPPQNFGQYMVPNFQQLQQIPQQVIIRQVQQQQQQQQQQHQPQPPHQQGPQFAPQKRALSRGSHPQDGSKMMADFASMTGQFSRTGQPVPAAVGQLASAPSSAGKKQTSRAARKASLSMPATPITPQGVTPTSQNGGGGKRKNGPATIKEGEEAFAFDRRSSVTVAMAGGSVPRKMQKLQAARSPVDARSVASHPLETGAHRSGSHGSPSTTTKNSSGTSIDGAATAPAAVHDEDVSPVHGSPPQSVAAVPGVGSEFDHTNGSHSFLQDFSAGSNDIFDFDSLLGTDQESSGNSGLKEVFNWGESVDTHEL
ncbi:DEKNAAC103622 [Brettanomyces naardenensis]|uniref:DEKNAAC103622 n=1 Tax=Brettanomyces naardenensis TaxID=13370 RepID=A0A448YNW3_BRENA|nr:DEKNAAC103622 [Brettanomyces naardenensis]